MAFPEGNKGFTIRERGRMALAALWLSGKQLVSDITYAYAQGASSNITLITIQAADKNGNPISGVRFLDIFLSDAATGIGVTGTTASGAVAAGAAGTDIVDSTAKKVKRILTDATGKYILSITDTAKTGFYVATVIPATGILNVSRQLITADYK